MIEDSLYNKTSFRQESNTGRVKKLFLFLLSPVLGLVGSLRSLNTHSSFLIVFLFCVTFGVAFSVSNVRETGTIDGISYRIQFEEMAKTPSLDYSEMLSAYLTFEEGGKDFYFFTVAYLVSRVTDNYHFLFMVLAVVFSYFQLRSLQFFTRSKYYRFSPIVLILLFFFTYNQIFNINGARFWTAAWIAVYACLRIFVDEKKLYYLLLLVTPLVHGSFFFIIAVILVALLLGRLELGWSILFVASFFVSSISVTLLQENLEYFPDFVVRLAAPYIDEDYINSIGKEGSGFYWVQKLFESIVPIFVNIMMAILILHRKSITDAQDKRLFEFLLVLITISNFFMAVPSLGGRFFGLCYPLIALLWLNHMHGRQANVVVYLLPVCFFMNIYYLINNYIGVLHIDFLLSPFYIVAKYLLG